MRLLNARATIIRKLIGDEDYKKLAAEEVSAEILKMMKMIAEVKINNI